MSKLYLIQKQAWAFKECMENIKIFKLRPTLYAGQDKYIHVFMVCLIRKLSWKFEEYTEE